MQKVNELPYTHLLLIIMNLGILNEIHDWKSCRKDILLEAKPN